MADIPEDTGFDVQEWFDALLKDIGEHLGTHETGTKLSTPDKPVENKPLEVKVTGWDGKMPPLEVKVKEDTSPQSSNDPKPVVLSHADGRPVVKPTTQVGDFAGLLQLGTTMKGDITLPSPSSPVRPDKVIPTTVLDSNKPPVVNVTTPKSEVRESKTSTAKETTVRETERVIPGSVTSALDPARMLASSTKASANAESVSLPVPTTQAKTLPPTVKEKEPSPTVVIVEKGSSQQTTTGAPTFLNAFNPHSSVNISALFKGSGIWNTIHNTLHPTQRPSANAQQGPLPVPQFTPQQGPITFGPGGVIQPPTPTQPSPAQQKASPPPSRPLVDVQGTRTWGGWFKALMNPDAPEKAQQELHKARRQVYQSHANVISAPLLITKAESQVAEARIELGRARASGQDREEAEANLQMARANLERTKARVHQAPEQLKQARAQLGQAEQKVGMSSTSGLRAGLFQMGTAVVEGVPKVMKSNTAMEAGSAGIGMVSGIAAGAATMAGMPGLGVGIVAVGTFASKVLEAADKLRSWTRELHNGNMQFAEFSASMAKVQAEQEIRDIDLSRQRGEYRADSVGKLAEAMSQLERSMAPLDDAWSKWRDEMIASVAEKVAGIFDIANKLANKFGLGLPDYDSTDSAEVTLPEWMANAADEYAIEAERRRPVRFPGGRLRP